MPDPDDLPRDEDSLTMGAIPITARAHETSDRETSGGAFEDDAAAGSDALGWDERWNAVAHAVLEGRPVPAEPEASRGGPFGQIVPARVIRVDRGRALVASLTDLTNTLPVSYGPALRDQPVGVGDWVLVEAGTIVAILPRRTELIRESVGGTSREQLLAANIDVVLIVEHLDPEPVPGRVERLLALAWQSGAQPLVVLTKADLVPDAGPERIARVAAAAPGVEVIVTSAESGVGLDELASRLGVGRTFVLLGPSGAGKSTLTNLLLGRDVMSVGARRESDGKGRHTTTHRELIVAPGRGILIDTPGRRTVSVVASLETVATVFEDIAELAARCRFSDCAHEGEPGCAVAEALADGSLDRRRFDSYRRIQREAAFHARRSDARLASEDRSRIRAIERSRRAEQRLSGR